MRTITQPLCAVLALCLMCCLVLRADGVSFRLSEVVKPRPPKKLTTTIYRRRHTPDSQRLISGPPDEWFTEILKKFPEELTLDEIEDMTVDERTDYVGQFDFEGAAIRPVQHNLVKHLLRLEALGRKYHRLRPGEDGHVPHDDPSQPFGEMARFADNDEPEVPPEDYRMSSPRWHLQGEKEEVERDPVWRRRTARRRPTAVKPTHINITVVEPPPGSATARGRNVTSNITAEPDTNQTKPTVIIESQDEVHRRKSDYDQKHTTSTVRRLPTTRLTTREQRTKMRRHIHKTLSEDDRLQHIMKDDPGRCIGSASKFCQGLTYRYAEFVDCMLANTDKFEPHDDFCVHDVQFYAPCRRDMVENCPEMKSHEVVECMVELAGHDAKELLRLDHDEEIVETLIATADRKLSNECLTSEHMETMILYRPKDRNLANDLSEAQKRIIYKYQHFWLSQHDDPTTDEDDDVDAFELADRYRIVTSDEL